MPARAPGRSAQPGPRRAARDGRAPARVHRRDHVRTGGGGGDGEAHMRRRKAPSSDLVRSLAVEVAPHGVRVNGVAPGPTDTPLLAADSPWRATDYLATLPARRLATPHEIAEVVRYLVSEDAGSAPAKCCRRTAGR